MTDVFEYTLKLLSAENTLEGVWDGDFWTYEVVYHPGILEEHPPVGWVWEGTYVRHEREFTIRIKLVYHESVPQELVFDSRFPGFILEDFVRENVL